MEENKKIDFKKIGIIAAIVIVVAIIAGVSIYCVINKETPTQLIQDIVTPDNEQILGKWQGEKGITGYEFFDDETYDSYILGFSTRKKYQIDGSKLILKSNADGRRVVYKYKINGDTLTLTLVESEGNEVKTDEESTFTKVENFHFKSASSALEDFADQLQKQVDEDEEKETEKQE